MKGVFTLRTFLQRAGEGSETAVSLAGHRTCDDRKRWQAYPRWIMSIRHPNPTAQFTARNTIALLSNVSVNIPPLDSCQLLSQPSTHVGCRGIRGHWPISSLGRARPCSLSALRRCLFCPAATRTRACQPSLLQAVSGSGLRRLTVAQARACSQRRHRPPSRSAPSQTSSHSNQHPQV